MTDEDDDEDPLKFHVTSSEIRQIVTTDLVTAKENSERAIEETKAQISGLVNKLSILNCCGIPQAEDGAELEIRNSDVQAKSSQVQDFQVVLRKSVHAITEKAKLDMQVARLMDREEVKETSVELKEFYYKTKQATQLIGKQFRQKQAKSAKEVEENKQIIDKSLKEFAQNLPIQCNVDNLDNFLTSLVDKSAADFGKQNEKMTEMTEATKAHFSKYVSSVFPPVQVTTEELQSEDILKRDMSKIKDKIIEDIKIKKGATDQSIEEVKRCVSQYPEEILEKIKNIPTVSMKKIREKTFGINEDFIIETAIGNDEQNDSEEREEEHVVEYHEHDTSKDE